MDYTTPSKLEGHRVMPTREDQMIFERNFQRMFRWDFDDKCPDFIRALNNWRGDYLHKRI